jgi:hypothetical protein
VERNADQAVFAFDCARGTRASAMVVDGAWKLALPAERDAVEAGLLEYVYDLVRDPAEKTNLVGAPPPPAARVLERRKPSMSAYLVPLLETEQALVSEENLRAMQALGYVEDGSQ